MKKGDNVRLTVDVRTPKDIMPKGSTGKILEHDNEYMPSLFVTMDDGRIFNLSKDLFEVYTKPKKVRNPEDFDLVGREVKYDGHQGRVHSIAHGGTATVVSVDEHMGVWVEVEWVGKRYWMKHEYALSGGLRPPRWVHIGDMVADRLGMLNVSRVTGLKEKSNGDIVATLLAKDGTEEKVPMKENDKLNVLVPKRKKGSLTW